MASVNAYVGVGSNLDDPARQVRRALDALGRIARSTLAAHSSAFRNPAIGPGEQPDYVNAVARIDTCLEPHALLDALQSIERAQGRTRGALRWTARTLDLDLLLYGTRCINDERLVVPHPRLHERAFVLAPLYEIAPALSIPGKGSVRALLEGVSLDELTKVEA